VVDVGGRGFGPDAGEVYEEGLLIPISKFAERGAVNDFMVKMVRANVRTPDQTVGDMYSLAACNEAGNRRLQAMLDEFDLDDIDGLSDYIIEASRRATREAIAEVPDGTYRNQMRVDGYDAPVDMHVRLDVSGDRVVADFDGTSGMSKLGVNVPEVYTRAYACYALKCSIAPEVPNNTGSLEPFEITAPEGSILAARRPAPVSVRHVIGHLVPDVVLGALHQALPGVVPAEGASALWNIQISARPVDAASNLPSAEVLMFNSGGTGARPSLDGLSATAFPSGVSTMSVEATEHVGPIVVWRKELREGSGGAGASRGGLGQVIEIEARDGYQFFFNAMFDRIDNPARGREGGARGAAGGVALSDGTKLQGKGRQKVEPGERLVLTLPGGGGYGSPMERDRAKVRADLAAGYITAEQARTIYGLDD
jgi:N-methylhydantoinase B